MVALVPLVVCFTNGLRSAAAPRLRPVVMMSGRPSLWDAYGPGPAGDSGAFRGSDTEGTRDSSPPLRERVIPAVGAPMTYAEYLAGGRDVGGPAATKVTAGPQGSESLRTIGLLGAALAVGVGFLALKGDTPIFDSLATYAADDGLSADVVPSFSLIFLSEIGDKTFF